jgi:hypothetical protein
LVWLVLDEEPWFAEELCLDEGLLDAVLLDAVLADEDWAPVEDAVLPDEAVWFALLPIEPELALADWLALLEVLLAIGLPETPSAARVCWSRPEPEMPCFCWKACSAFSVFGPMMPSIGPGS